MKLRAPFPYFGGKQKVADIVWQRFGNVKNYVEPFVGSAAVLLRRPLEHLAAQTCIETVNDKDGMVANFWRAITLAPEQTGHWADWPVNENDLHARHKWLIAQSLDRLPLEGLRRLQPIRNRQAHRQPQPRNHLVQSALPAREPGAV